MHKAVVISSLVIAIISLSVISIIYLSNTNKTLTMMNASNTFSVTSRNNFVTYQDTFYGIKIQYPSYWHELGFDKGGLVAAFVPPPDKNIKKETGIIENLVILVTKLPPSSSLGLKDYTDSQISTYRTKYQNFHLIRFSPETTSGGIPTFQIEYSYTTSNGFPVNILETFAKNGHEVYTLVYNADSPEYPEFESTMERVMDSFSIAQAAKTTPDLTRL